MTVEEIMLWDFLKEKKLDGERFRRQCGIGSYIVDFYCARMKLVIEVDGDVHKDTIEYDAERDAYLTGAGCKVLRFSNKQVRDRVYDVIESIRSEIATSPF